MGQQCCSASQNAPEIAPPQEQLAEQSTATPPNQKMIAREVKQQSQKQQFYGKDGHKYSKTVTKQMASGIDANLQEYKNKIFKKQITIKEAVQEQEDQVTQHQIQQSISSLSYGAIAGQFLDQMANSVVKKTQ